MYFVYIIYSSFRDKYYIGSCQDLTERLRRHNSNHKGFTGKTSGWEIKWSEEHVEKISALKREKQLKGWKSRTMIEKLIDQN